MHYWLINEVFVPTTIVKHHGLNNYRIHSHSCCNQYSHGPQLSVSICAHKGTRRPTRGILWGLEARYLHQPSPSTPHLLQLFHCWGKRGKGEMPDTRVCQGDRARLANPSHYSHVSQVLSYKPHECHSGPAQPFYPGRRAASWSPLRTGFCFLSYPADTLENCPLKTHTSVTNNVSWGQHFK